MAINSQVAVGLRGAQSLVVNLDATPVVLLDSPLPIGRHMMILANAQTSIYVGSVDLLIVPNRPAHTISTSTNCMINTVNGHSTWGFTFNDTIITLEYIGNNLRVHSAAPTSYLVIREFLIPNVYTGDNLYGIDAIAASNPAPGSPLNIQCPLVLSSQYQNACNLGQAQATQATSITTPVTANGASGTITTVSATTAAGATQSFTVNNSAVSPTSAITVSVSGYSGTTGFAVAGVRNIGAGSFNVSLTNLGSIALDGSVTLCFICA